MDIIGKEAVFVPQKYDLFFGLDVDKHSVAIVILDHAKEIRSLKMPDNGRMLINYSANKKTVLFLGQVGREGGSVFV